MKKIIMFIIIISSVYCRVVNVANVVSTLTHVEEKIHNEKAYFLKGNFYSTGTNDGTVIWSSVVGSIQSIGITFGLSYEIILKTNTTYAIKVTKDAINTHYVDYDLFWIEH